MSWAIERIPNDRLHLEEILTQMEDDDYELRFVGGGFLFFYIGEAAEPEEPKPTKARKVQDPAQGMPLLKMPTLQPTPRRVADIPPSEPLVPTPRPVQRPDPSITVPAPAPVAAEEVIFQADAPAPRNTGVADPFGLD